MKIVLLLVISSLLLSNSPKNNLKNLQLNKEINNHLNFQAKDENLRLSSRTPIIILKKD